MDFMPIGHEKMVEGNKYWNTSKMEQGDHKFRVMCRPITGWIDWLDNKPVHYRPESKPAAPLTEDGKVKEFWALYVWDYAREDLFILKITQVGILKTLKGLAKDEDWGNWMDYDLKLTKEGSGKDTEYSLKPAARKDVTSKMKDALSNSPVCLDALYENGDPWSTINEANPMEELEFALIQDGLSVSELKQFLTKLSADNSKTISEVVSQAISGNEYDKFKSIYAKFTKQKVAV